MKPLRDPLAGGLKNNRKTVLREGCDPRVIEAAIAARKEGVTRIVLIGNVATITEQLANAGGGNITRIEVHDPTDTPLADEMAQMFYDCRKHNGITPESAREAVLNPSVFAALLAKMDKVYGAIGSTGPIDQWGDRLTLKPLAVLS